MKHYDKLYISILEAGQSNVESGLSYNDLKIILIKQGYDFENDCIELAVKHWFYYSFHHIGQDDHLINYEDLKNHLDCNFIMTGEACLKLIEFKTAATNLKIAVWAIVLAAISILLSLLLPLLQ